MVKESSCGLTVLATRASGKQTKFTGRAYFTMLMATFTKVTGSTTKLKVRERTGTPVVPFTKVPGGATSSMALELRSGQTARNMKGSTSMDRSTVMAVLSL